MSRLHRGRRILKTALAEQAVSGMKYEDICDQCEEWMQPYMDRELSDAERAEAEAHLEGCGYCRKRYRFEESLRIFVREVCAEEMAPALKAKLSVRFTDSALAVVPEHVGSSGPPWRLSAVEGSSVPRRRSG